MYAVRRSPHDNFREAKPIDRLDPGGSVPGKGPGMSIDRARRGEARAARSCLSQDFAKKPRAAISCLRQDLLEGFQTFQTLPTSSGPGLSAGCPGFHPEGVASVPLLARTY